MFCGKCGNKINDDALFCNKCGEKVAGTKITMSKDERMRVMTGASLLVLLITSVLGGMFCYFFRASHEGALKGNVINAKVLQTISGANPLQAEFEVNSEICTVSLSKEKLTRSYKNGDKILVVLDKNNSSMIYSYDIVERVKGLLRILMSMCIVSGVLGCVLMKVVVIDWDNRFIIEEYKEVR